MGVVTALWVAVWWCLMAPHTSGLCYLLCHPIMRFSPFLGAVLCSMLGFPCLRVDALLACGVPAPVRCRVCSLGCPSWLVLLLRSLLVLHLLFRWGGLVTGLWPLLLLLCVGLLWGLCCTVLSPWGSYAPYPVGSLLGDSYGFVVRAPGVFLGSLLGSFPLASSGSGWLGVVVACTSCGVPYLWLALCSSPCVRLGGCPSFSQVGPARSHWVPLLWTWCA